MSHSDNFFDINRHSWNNRLEAHLKSDFYDVQGFIEGKNSLREIELSWLGDITSKKVLHLQCHFGQDSISLSRLGAKVTGVDFSDKAIDAARKLAKKLNDNTEFVCCNLYDLPKILDDTYDIVFTSYGTIIWLPDLDKWSRVISKFLSPEGRFLMVDFHPFIWLFDDDFKKISYDYFNIEPVIETVSGTYTDRSADISQQSVTWNHPLSDVIQSLINNGMAIDKFEEYDYLPFNTISHLVEESPGQFRLKDLAHKIPMTYAIQAHKIR